MGSSPKNIRLIVILVASVALVFATLSVAFYRPLVAKVSLFSQCVLQDTPTEQGPSIWTTTMDFAEHDEYQNLSRHEDARWADLMTPNGGFLIKADDEGVAQRLGIGMFHQLHCLTMIREALRDGMNPSTQPTSMPQGIGAEERNGHDPGLHILHCLDYLRQVRGEGIRNSETVTDP
jgi:hypothetical protein